MKDFTHEEKEFVFVEEEGCVCNKCIFNHIVEGNLLCKIAPDCENKGYYILKLEV